MKRVRGMLLLALALPGLWPGVSVDAQPATGALLKPGAGRDLVTGHCSGCHSLALVTAQRGDRQFWLDTIRWMQKKHNLWALPAQQEALILDYLATHYADVQWGRRPALPDHLLPGTPVP